MPSDCLQATWEEQGFLVIPAFFQKDSVAALKKEYQRIWANPPRDLVVDDLSTLRRARLRNLFPFEKKRPFFKVNDLYLLSEVVRDHVLDRRLVRTIEALLNDKPVVCNTLNLLRGSQQPHHVDSWYMTPKTPNALVATWIALDPIDESNGPLEYYPGSHQIPAYQFSDGGRHAIAEERTLCEDYYKKQVEERGLKKTRFYGNAGDLFIWHSQLLHGGARVEDLKRTRDSLVTHYYAHSDCKDFVEPLCPLNGGYWWQRGPQPVPQSRKLKVRNALARCAGFFAGSPSTASASQ